MSQTSAQDRERAVHAITRRNMLERRIKRTQLRMASLQGEARQALEDSLAADQAALSEITPTMDTVKAVMRRQEEHIRRKTQGALRAKAEWRASYFLHHFPGGGQPGTGQAMGLLLVLAALVAIVGVLLLLNR